MENVPIEKGIGVMKWWATLKPAEKTLTVLLACLLASATINVYQFAGNSGLQKDNLSYAKECEARAAIVAIKERNRGDSLLALEKIKYEIQLQKLFSERTPEIKERNEKIQKVLK